MSIRAFEEIVQNAIFFFCKVGYNVHLKIILAEGPAILEHQDSVSFPVFEFESLEPPTSGAEKKPVIAAIAGTRVP